MCVSVLGLVSPSGAFHPASSHCSFLIFFPCAPASPLCPSKSSCLPVATCPWEGGYRVPYCSRLSQILFLTKNCWPSSSAPVLPDGVPSSVRSRGSVQILGGAAETALLSFRTLLVLRPWLVCRPGRRCLARLCCNPAARPSPRPPPPGAPALIFVPSLCIFRAQWPRRLHAGLARHTSVQGGAAWRVESRGKGWPWPVGGCWGSE